MDMKAKSLMHSESNLTESQLIQFQAARDRYNMELAALRGRYKVVFESILGGDYETSKDAD